MSDTIYFWLFPLGILSFLYFLRWIIPPLLHWVLWTLFPPRDRDVPYVSSGKDGLSSWAGSLASAAMANHWLEYHKTIGPQLQNYTPVYRQEDLQNSSRLV